ncbi:type II secretion system F family protein [Xenorhabdus nematophila]|uniref:type II secretion system F family protein n=1 Tax=Xenorhabdus nematophila TaxID=628 RepID=UPI0032B77099
MSLVNFTGLGFWEIKEKIVHYVCKKTFSSKHRRDFYETLAFMLRNGKKLGECLNEIKLVHTDFGKKWHPFEVLCDFCLQALADNNQNTFESVLAEWGPIEEAALVGAGMKSGDSLRLANALDQAVRLVECRQKIQAVITKIMIYPVVLAMLTSFLVYITSNKVVPILSRISDPETWTGALAFTYGMTTFFENYLFLMMFFIVAIYCLVSWSMPNWTGKIRHFADYFMPWSIYSDLQGAVFLMNMSSLMSANMRTLESLILLSKFSSKWLREKLDGAIDCVNNGSNFGEALYYSGHNFPSKEAAGQLYLLSKGDGGSQLISNFGDRWLDETLKRLNIKANLIMISSLALIASFFILIMSVIMQIQSMTESAQSF